ncbi:hypothetical protein [Chitinilyticum aquatile]|uniref:hypothetical protein n=1 Tax=Chitinilyticum aquatile TaxID=362520 RepID=UPI0004201183|nr:hypothetical protein [Chitinilyticum aquatile]
MTSTSESDSAASPYTPPVASLAGENEGSPAGRSRLLLITSWLLVVIALLLAIALQLVVPAFRELFATFGADLPAITELLLNFSPVYFLVPLLLLILAIWITQRREHDMAFRRMMGWINAGGILLLVVALASSVLALYAPMFSMCSCIPG